MTRDSTITQARHTTTASVKIYYTLEFGCYTAEHGLTLTRTKTANGTNTPSKSWAALAFVLNGPSTMFAIDWVRSKEKMRVVLMLRSSTTARLHLRGVEEGNPSRLQSSYVCEIQVLNSSLTRGNKWFGERQQQSILFEVHQVSVLRLGIPYANDSAAK